MSRRSAGWLLLSLVLAASVYALLAAYHLSLPGVNYDEVIHVNAALGGVDGSFITYQWHGIPLLLNPYVGALKAYLAAPWFALFGVNPISLRLPMILLAAIGMVPLWFLARRIADTKTAWIVLALAVVDPNFIAITRVDFGPVVLAWLARVGALLLVVSWFKSRRPVLLFWLVVVLALGLFNKLDFIWFINALVGGLMLVYGKMLWREVRRGGWQLAGLMVVALSYLGYIAYYWWISRYFSLFMQIDLSAIPERLHTMSYGLQGFLSGEQFSLYAFTHTGSSIARGVVVSMLVLLLLGSLVVLFRPSQQALRQRFVFLWVMVGLILAQMLPTKTASAPWHYFGLYPLATLLCGIALIELYRFVRARISVRAAVVAALLVVVLLIVHRTWLYTRTVRAYSNPENIGWTPGFNELVSVARASTTPIVSGDWGTHTQLVVFDPVPGKYSEASYALQGIAPNPDDIVLDGIFPVGAERLLILHPEGQLVFSDTRTNFFAYAKRRDLSLTHERDITYAGRVVFELYRVRR